jgi:hypothetical protein
MSRIPKQIKAAVTEVVTSVQADGQVYIRNSDGEIRGPYHLAIQEDAKGDLQVVLARD